MPAQTRSGARLVRAAITLACLGLGGAVPTASAQYLDARVLHPGVLRVGFAPSFTQSDRRFDADGEREPLGADFSADSAGVLLLPSLAPAEAAVGSMIGDPSYRMTLGAAKTDLDADVRQVEFSLQLGLTGAITFSAAIPIITTRTQVAFTLDSTGANVGWNPVASQSGIQFGLENMLDLLDDLNFSMASLESLIASGAFDCPTGPTCTAARDLVARTGAFRTDLMALAGLDGDGSTISPLPPFAPLASSAAGQTLQGMLEDIAAELTSFGADAILASLTLPTSRVTAEDVNTVLTSAGFGYGAQPLAFVKYRQRPGDAALGFRWGLVQRPSVRAALTTTVRLPTGLRDLPDNFVDIGTGDRQLDLIGGVELVFEPGNVLSLALGGEYTYQMKDELPRRVTSPHRPIALASTEFVVTRDLGDFVRLRAFPALRLHPNLRAYASVEYFSKQSDVFTLAESTPGAELVNVADMEIDTGMQMLSIGGGLHYRSVSRTGRLPVEAGLHYQTAFQGSGGLTPKPTSLNLYLRLFYPIFGRPPANGEQQAASEER